MSTPADRGAFGPRSLLATLGMFVGLTLVVVLASTIAGVLERAPTRPAPMLAGAAPPDAATLAFFGALAAGVPFEGWVIDRIDGPRAGGLPLVLRGPAAQQVAVELRPADPRSPASPAASETLAIYVIDRNMPPGGLEGVLAFARALRSREATGARLAGLWPLLAG
ncbi:MAG TPA: hypothetical protein VGB85_15130 [Nannocystis sp.]